MPACIPPFIYSPALVYLSTSLRASCFFPVGRSCLCIACIHLPLYLSVYITCVCMPPSLQTCLVYFTPTKLRLSSLLHLSLDPPIPMSQPASPFPRTPPSHGPNQSGLTWMEWATAGRG